MRKLILVVISFALFIFGYPVLARYYNSSMDHRNPNPGSGSGFQDFPIPQRGVNLANLPKPGIPNNPVSGVSKPQVAPKGPDPILINKNNGLPPTYVPPDLTVPDVPFSFEEDLPKKKMTPEAAQDLEKLFAQAKKEQIELVGVSAYRSYDYQQVVYERNVTAVGSEAAGRTSAPPGHSEHQSGLAIDVSSPKLNYRLDERFGDTEAGQWLAVNASKFGFIIRYPQGKEETTGYQYEPWHLRYVGEEHARELAKEDVTLEEYLDRLQK